jgi:hypothetical protein
MEQKVSFWTQWIVELQYYNKNQFGLQDSSKHSGFNSADFV